MDIRKIEKLNKYGYMFVISYDGKKFDSFDENPGKHSVKGEFSRRMKEMGFSWAKGIQQAGRTDSGVSADGNILYVSSNFNGETEIIKEAFNRFDASLKIKSVIKTLPNLVMPDLISKRVYFYRYSLEKAKRSIAEIAELCAKLSGTYDVSEFTDSKGMELKEKIRTVEIKPEKGGLLFEGSSFMPKQVRIMAGYILSGEKKIFPAKNLILREVVLKNDVSEMIYRSEEIKPELMDYGIIKAEKIDDITVFYCRKEDKSRIIGTNGNNIKKLRKELGNIVVKEL